MNPNPGWFPDPSGKFAERYWDGNAWTASVRTQETPWPDERHSPTPPAATTSTSDPNETRRSEGRVPPSAPELAAADSAPPPAQPELPPPEIAASPQMGGPGETSADSAQELEAPRPLQFNGKVAFWIGAAVIGLFAFWAGVQDTGAQVDNRKLDKQEAAFVAAVEEHEGYDASVSEEANWARYGQSVCRTLGEGQDPAFVAANLGMSLGDGNFIVNTAITYLCPQHK